MKNNIMISNLTIEELKEFFLVKRYTFQTQNIIKAIFIDNMKQNEIAKLLEITPQRITNIKNQFLIDYSDDHRFIRFEAIIPVEKIGDYFPAFRKECKFFQIKIKSSPPRSNKKD